MSKKALCLLNLHRYAFSLLSGVSYARYHIVGAKDTGEARSFEDIIQTFFGKHSALRLCGIFGETIAMEGSFVAIICCSFCCNNFLRTSSGLSRVLHFRGYLSNYLFGYIAWTHYTPDTPSLSFYRSLIWSEEPKSNAKWALIFTILMGVFIAYLTTLL